MPTSPAGLIPLLKALPHFRLVPPVRLAAIAESVRIRGFEAQQAIFTERTPAKAFFAILSGGARLFRRRPDGREQVINQLGPGQSFGEAAALSFGVYPVSAAATETPTDLLEIPAEAITRQVQSDEGLAGAIIGSLAMKLLELVERVEELASANAATRVARYLVRLPGEGPSTRPVVELPFAKKDLAVRLSITPETLSRVLRKWQNGGIVEVTQRTLVLVDPARLLAIADGEEDPALGGGGIEDPAAH